MRVCLNKIGPWYSIHNFFLFIQMPFKLCAIGYEFRTFAKNIKHVIHLHRKLMKISRCWCWVSKNDTLPNCSGVSFYFIYIYQSYSSCKISGLRSFFLFLWHSGHVADFCNEFYELVWEFELKCHYLIPVRASVPGNPMLTSKFFKSSTYKNVSLPCVNFNFRYSNVFNLKWQTFEIIKVKNIVLIEKS